MNILLVYPQYPDTYWSFKHALKFISKKASNIPLGLITVASLLPENWKRKLVDINVSRLRDEDIKWADYVFISAMSVQLASVKQIIGRCMQARVLTFLKQYDPPSVQSLSFNRFMALIKSIIYIGILKKESIYFWKIISWSIFNKPRTFPLAVTYSIYGYHFRRVFRNVI
jgi:hypothetical protein